MTVQGVANPIRAPLARMALEADLAEKLRDSTQAARGRELALEARISTLERDNRLLHAENALLRTMVGKRPAPYPAGTYRDTNTPKSLGIRWPAPRRL